MKKGFTIIELLVAMGLFAAVIAAAGMIFNYSIESQRTAAATAEIMRTLRAITDQIDIDFQSLRTDGYLILYSEQVGSDNYDALYYFSTGDYQSWADTSTRSNIARIFLGHSQSTYTGKILPGDLARDILLLVPGYTGTGNDVKNISFAECQAAITNLENPNTAFFTTGRPPAGSTNIGSLFAQKVGSFRIEWTNGISGNRINWSSTAITCTPTSSNWPKALKFTFTLYDSKRILKGGRTFEHIVYIGP
ncbi:MAG: prepilin-type N-terminal cleavage/methylation domain-containing protein [Sedimentisphaerales bacterium]